jgi:endogenous inhibitor of DNA gyrase (YacG/DUF329 family)
MYCQKELTKRQIIKKGKFCSQQCAVIMKNKPKPRIVKEKPYKKICPNCGVTMEFTTETKMKDRTYCSKKCANNITAKNPEAREKRRETINKNGGWSSFMKKRHILNPNIAKMASERMKKNNPMSNPDSVEKMRQKLIGREFLHRGGNGKTTKPQELLYNLLGDGWIMEFAINTKDVREKFNKIPYSYKTDIANPDLKISIEIDGMSHKLKKKMELDLKKTQVLNSLGWKVLRFWNKEVMTNSQMCLQKIQEFMI